MRLKGLAFGLLAPLALAACGGKGGGAVNGVTTPPAPTPSAQAFQDKFGTSFAATFNASATVEPKDPAAGDVPALNLTAEPLDN